MIHPTGKPPIPSLAEITQALRKAPPKPTFDGETFLVVVEDEMKYARDLETWQETPYFEKVAMMPTIELKAREYRRICSDGDQRMLRWIYTGEFHL